jgi:hypothetical protein
MHASFSWPRLRRRTGFSLIEVNMAILVVAGGMLTLVTLFPAGLRMSTSAMADTRQALFASDTLNSLRAKAATLSLGVWMNKPSGFWAQLCEGTPVGSAYLVTETLDVNEQTLVVEGEISTYFASAGDNATGNVPVRYKIRIHRRRPKDETGDRERKLDTRNQHLDYLTWRITMAATDRPDLDLQDINFEDFPLYHLEIRYAQRP